MKYTIKFECDIPEVGDWVYGYDPRVCRIDDKYYVTWCNGYHGPTIGIAWTKDFKTFHQLENAFLPYNRNGVMFPRKINGNYAMLSRPSDTGHTPFGDIFYSESRTVPGARTRLGSGGDTAPTPTWSRGHWLFPAALAGGALGAGSVRPEDRGNGCGGRGSGLGRPQPHLT